jgi:multiple sugar transport system permease protein
MADHVGTARPQALRLAETTRFVRHQVRPDRVLIWLLLTLGAIAMAFPFVWMVSTSLKPDNALFVTPPQLIPRPFQPANYSRIANEFPFWRFVLNSLLVSAVSTALQIITSAMAAYAFSRLRFRGQNLVFLLYLGTLMVPFQVIVVPLFVEMRYANLVNTYPGLILPAIASAFGTFLLRQAFMTLPKDFDEAAFIDGASHWTVFTRIVLPLSGPALATFAVFAFMASWNSFLWPLVIVNSPDLMTLPVGLASLQGRFTTAWNLVMAGATVSVIPILIVYVFAQKYVVQGFAQSGIKG